MGVVLPALLAGVACGIVGRDAGVVLLASPALPALAALAGLAMAVLARRTAAVALTAACLGLALGAWRGAAAELPLGPDSVAAQVAAGELRLQGTATDEPRPRGERQQVVLEAVTVDARELAGRVLVWLPRGLQVGTGDVLAFDAELEAPKNFDGFAYRDYLARQGVAAIASPRQARVVDHRLGPLQQALRGLRLSLLGGLNRLVPEPEAALAAGIVLGVRSGIDPAINDAFAAAGLTHVVAISGWNIAIVATLAAAAARPLTRLPGGRIGAALAAATTVTGYVLLTGASPSVLRAALMAGALLLARLGGSRSHALSALMLAALAMLLVAPAVAWDVGFQLSGLATAGLIWFGAPFEARLARWPALVREPVALTMAAQVTTLPVILLNFERLSLIAPLANVVVVPLVPIVMLAGALAALAGALPSLPLLGPFLAWAAGGSAWLYVRLMTEAGMLAAAVPMASVPLAAPAWLAVAWYPTVAAFHRRIARAATSPERASEPGGFATGLVRPRFLAAGTLLVLAAVTVATRPDGRLHLVALDVGQGDAILVRSPTGEVGLMDGGPDPDLAMRRLGEWLPFWERRLDAVILSHPHEDHVAGLVPALERFAVGTVLDPGREYDNPSYGRFLDLATQEPPGTYQRARAGLTIDLGPATRLAFLYPTQEDAAAPLLEDDINNGSVVVLLTSGGFSALLTGDAEAPVEALLLERGLVPDVDVLKVGHHGSESSSSVPFLAAARPETALISCGAGNEYGHPHAVTLEHLAALGGVTVRRTDLEGSVEIVVAPRPLASVHGGSRPRPGDGAPRIAGAAGRGGQPFEGRRARGGRGRSPGERGRRARRRAAGGGGWPAARHRQARDPPERRAARRGCRGAAGRDGLRRARRPGGVPSGDLPAG
jgi:competence protein ComEC